MNLFKCYIIRLKDHPFSEKIALETKTQAKKFNIDAEFFDGIYGNEVETHYRITQVPRPRKNLKKGRLGVLGCFFSHYYLWKKCVKENIPFLILEHDGYIIKPIPDDILDKFDDVLKLDRCDPYSGDYNTVLNKEKDFKLIVEKYWNKDAKNPAKIGTGNYFKGAYVYLLKPEGAKKLLDFIHKNKTGIGHRTADQQIGDAVLNTHTTIPSLARLHPFYSINDNLKTMSLTVNPDLLKIL
jgi:GR25 family glycosyltransferase involved in LPS biosynthesis